MMAIQAGGQHGVIACQHQYGNVESCQPHGVGNGALVAEVGQRDNHSIDFFTILLEQSCTALGLLVSFHSAMLAVIGPEDDAVHAGLGQRLNHLFAPGLGQLVGEKTAVANDDAHRHLSVSHKKCLLSKFENQFKKQIMNCSPGARVPAQAKNAG